MFVDYLALRPVVEEQSKEEKPTKLKSVKKDKSAENDVEDDDFDPKEVPLEDAIDVPVKTRAKGKSKEV